MPDPRKEDAPTKPEEAPQKDAQKESEVTQNPAAQPGETRENPLPAGTVNPSAETASEQINAGTPLMTA